jgi:hypothetical protein
MAGSGGKLNAAGRPRTGQPTEPAERVLDVLSSYTHELRHFANIAGLAPRQCEER